MLSRHVGSKMLAAADYALPFRPTGELLALANLTIGNLESPFYNQGPRVAEGMVFKAEPEAVVGLKLAGFDVFSLANNHALNQGAAGLAYTIDYLKENNIAPIGVEIGSTQTPAIISTGDLTFGFLGYSYLAISPQLSAHSSQNWQVAGMEIEPMQAAVRELKKAVDVVVVQMHAGEEYTNQPNKQQIEFARGAIDAGADLVIGHHPHWPQIVEQYQSKWIFYSLGNFVFDQEWSQETKEGLILQATWQNQKLQELKLLPVVIENFSTPRLADTKESQEILGKIGLSRAVVWSTDLTD
jgi:poly-gamma-glutamate synthesis protein (capsule biosynthesis protein)